MERALRGLAEFEELQDVTDAKHGLGSLLARRDLEPDFLAGAIDRCFDRRKPTTARVVARPLGRKRGDRFAPRSGPRSGPSSSCRSRWH